MSKQIETRVTPITQKEALQQSLQTVFEESKGLLRKNGKVTRGIIFNHIEARLDVTSTEPKMPVKISTGRGTDLEKVEKIIINIEGVGKLGVTERKKKEKKEYTGRHSLPYDIYEYSVDGKNIQDENILKVKTNIVENFVSAIRQTVSEFGTKSL